MRGNHTNALRDGVIPGPEVWLRLNSDEISNIINAIEHGLAKLNEEKKTEYRCKFLHMADCQISNERELAAIRIDWRPQAGHFFFPFRGKDEIEQFQRNLNRLPTFNLVDH